MGGYWTRRVISQRAFSAACTHAFNAHTTLLNHQLCIIPTQYARVQHPLIVVLLGKVRVGPVTLLEPRDPLITDESHAEDSRTVPVIPRFMLPIVKHIVYKAVSSIALSSARKRLRVGTAVIPSVEDPEQLKMGHMGLGANPMPRPTCSCRSEESEAEHDRRPRHTDNSPLVQASDSCTQVFLYFFTLHYTPETRNRETIGQMQQLLESSHRCGVQSSTISRSPASPST